MKTLKRFLFFIVGIGLFIACSKSDHFWGDDPFGNTMKGDHGQPVMVTLPFKADLIGVYEVVEPDVNCGYSEENPFMYHVIVTANGTATHLGKTYAYFDFCCDFATGVYGPAEIYIIAANGDKLFLSGEGQVLEGRLDYHPDYVISYWKDPMIVMGGTGSFEGATGTIMSDDYNSSEDPYSHHHWKGTITMVKGKQ
jgi:hypothetical protein